MIITEKFYAVECDVCGKQSENYDGICFWADKETSEEQAMDNELHEEGNKHYCPNCHSFDDNDELIIKTK